MNRSTIILITLLLILGAITYFLLPSEKEHETSYESQDLGVKLDSASVVKISIQQKTKSVTMENVGGRWMLTSPIHYAADATAVKQLLSGLSKFKAGSLVSSNPEKQNIYQVDSTGTWLQVTDRAGKSVGMVIGKMGPSFSEVYFRLPDSKDVYLGEGIDTWAINKEVKDWRDKSIVSISSESIKGLAYTVTDKHFEFTRDSSGWKSRDRKADAATMNSTTNQLATLHADDFIDSLMKIETHPIVLALQGTENITLNLYPSTPDSSKYYVQLSSSPQLFVISKWTAQQLLKPVEEAVAPTKPALAKKQPAVRIPEAVVEQKSPPQPTVKKEEPPLPPKSDSLGTAVRTLPKPKSSNLPAAETRTSPTVSPKTQTSADDEGELTVHTVVRGETMTTIAKRYNVSVEQVLKWNLLKSIEVKPGQELYIYVKK